MPATRHYLITGGAGFIGSHLCDALLAAGHMVSILDDLSTGRREQVPSGVPLIEADIASDDAARGAMAQVNGVFHLAAIASVARGNEDWVRTHRVNQTGTVLILDAARPGRLPVVYASSAAIYGDAGEGAVSEDRRPAPQTAYGADKFGSELHAHVARLVHGVPTLGFRFFNVYGPRQDPHSPYSGVISIFARRIAAGEPISLHGGGEQTRDFVHVSDVVAHLAAGMRALEAGQMLPPALNVCTGRSVSVRQLAGRLAALHGVDLRAEAGPARTGDIKHSLGDPSLALATLGLRASVDLDQGLATLTG